MLNHSLLLFLIIIGLVGCAKPVEYKEVAPRTVLIAKVKDTAASGVRSFVGSLQASDRARLSFEASGTVVQINVELGQRFKSGDILAKLNATQAELTLEGALAELDEAIANLEKVELDHKRYEALLEKGAISVSSMDQSLAQRQRAKALATGAKAAVAVARKKLEDVYLRAPFDGEVVARLVEPFQVIGAGQGVLEVIGQGDRFEGVVTVSDATRSSIHMGNSAMLKLIASGQTVPASIIEIGNRANSAGLFPVTVTLNQAPKNAHVGQAIEVTFSQGSDDLHLFIPVTAYTVDATGQNFVLVLGEDKTLLRKPVELGEFSDAAVRVLDGVEAEDQIVTHGVDLLVDGQRVEPINQQTAALRYGSE